MRRKDREAVTLLRKECEKTLSFLREAEETLKKKDVNTGQLMGRLTKKVGDMFYPICMLINSGHLDDQKIEKASLSAQKRHEKR